jgi:UDP-N-acetylmuramate dehydrogenase
LVKFSAGENWHDAVMWAVENNYGGIENLSLIPGKCGAAPMQNIGAYGIEIKDVLLAVYAFDTEKKQEFIFHNHECGFGYRTSNFKTIWKDKFIITEIVLKLTKPGYHIIDKSYGAIQSELDARGIGSPSIKDLSDVVIHIRQSKLPDPQELGNAGSFFKNPVISTSKFEALKSSFPEMPHYPAQDKIKLPAGWLIDQCGWKGITEGQVGTYKHQALVLVNHGQASGEDVLNFSKKINASVEEKFGVELEMEVNVW